MKYKESGEELVLPEDLRAFQVSGIISDVIAEEGLSITYRPNWAKKLQSVNAAILLQQIIFRLSGKKNQPFYKFKMPCEHKSYKQGDSWCEELGFSRREFDAALSIISITAKQRKEIKAKRKVSSGRWQGLIITKIDSNRITWYSLSMEVFNDFTNSLYLKTDSAFSKRPVPPLPVKTDSAFTYKTYNTTKIKDSAPNGADGKTEKKKKQGWKGSTEKLTLDEFFKELKGGGAKHMKLIAWYANKTRPGFETKGQWHEFILRHTRAASKLTVFTAKQIDVAVRKINEANYLDSWTLETVLKYLTNGKKTKHGEQPRYHGKLASASS